MSLARRTVCFVVVLTAALHASFAAGQEAVPISGDTRSGTNLLTFRSTSALPDEAIDLIARVSLPVELTLPAGVRPEIFVRSVCGAYTKVFEARFLELNPSLILTP